MAFHIIAGSQEAPARILIRKIGFDDLRAALVGGWRDFLSLRSDLLMIGIIYPLIGLVLALWSSGRNVLPLLYPLMLGFALIGPLAAIGLYEISRRREQGRSAGASDALEVLRSPALPSILALGAALAVLFFFWLVAAQSLYQGLFGPFAPTDWLAFARQVFATPQGTTLVVVGNAIGLAFAAIAYCATVIAFPLLLDRDVGAAVAVAASFRAVARNPAPMFAWAVIVAGLLAVGFATLFVGLAVVMPVLGHASWRLYRTLVIPPAGVDLASRRD